MGKNKDKQIAFQESEKKRQDAKSCRPDDNYGERYVDPVADAHRQIGKGDKYRNIDGWYDDEIKLKLEKIFGKKKKTK